MIKTLHTDWMASLMVPNGVTICRNLPFKEGAKRPKQWAEAFVSEGKNEWSHHQRLFEENVRKTKKRWWSAYFENEGSGVVYARGRY